MRLTNGLKKLRIVLISLASVFAMGIVLLGVLFVMVYTGVFGQLPGYKELAAIKTEQASLVYSSDGYIIGKYFAKNRTNVKWEELPKSLMNALVATEDKRFFQHQGFDIRSYLRVFFRSLLLHDRSGGGGSTLTQQLIKNLYGRSDHGILSLPVNKMSEAILASRMEKVYSKEELLLLYLNSVPFGEDVFGVESAAHRYFNKSVSDLRVEESAVLVGMLKANTYFNPRINPVNSINRRNIVLNLMGNENYLSQNETDSLKLLPLQLDYENLQKKAPAGYFVYQVEKQANRILSTIADSSGNHYDIEKDGLKIFTTLNYDIQQNAANAIKGHLSRVQHILDADLKNRGYKNRWVRSLETDSSIKAKDFVKHKIELFDWDSISTSQMTTADSLWHYEKMLNSAVLVTAPQTGAILCWIGGNNYRYLPFDMVLSHRQIASAFKPILYASAFENGVEPCSYFENRVVKYTDYDDWEPQNFDMKSTPDSLVAAWYALAHSMNIPTVDLYFKNGMENLQATCNKMGLSIPTTEFPSIALGAVDVSLYEIVRAYSVFARRGLYSEFYSIEKIEDANGMVIYKHSDEVSTQVMDSTVCDKVTAILRHAINEGTGTKIRSQFAIQSDLAGKTGTAQNYSNAWFVAFTPNLLVGTWVGARSPSIHFSSAYGTGSSMALPIAGQLLKQMEDNAAFKEQYLNEFAQFANTSNEFECPPYEKKGLKALLNRIFNLENQTVDEPKIQQKKTKQEGDSKGFFKRLFRKKQKK